MDFAKSTHFILVTDVDGRQFTIAKKDVFYTKRANDSNTITTIIAIKENNRLTIDIPKSIEFVLDLLVSQRGLEGF